MASPRRTRVAFTSLRAGTGARAAAAAGIFVACVAFQGAATAAERVQPVSALATVPLRHSRTLYVVRGRMSGALGRFVVNCSARAAPATRYTLMPTAPDTTAAVDGRGVNRATLLVASRPSLAGGAGSGVETWNVGVGNEVEDVTLRASLYAVSPAGAKPAYCLFALVGSLTDRAH